MSIWAKIEPRLPRRLVRLWCKHPKMYVPVYPMLGPAPFKVCEHCGASQTVMVAEYDSLELRMAEATLVEMTGNPAR